jgi:hypothetical protein
MTMNNRPTLSLRAAKWARYRKYGSGTLAA